MSDPNTAPGEQPPAPETAPAPTTGAQPAVTDHSATLQTLDQEQLGNMLFGEKKEPATESVPTPPTPDVAGAQPTAPEETAGPDSSKPISRNRISVSGMEQESVKEMATIAEMIRKGEATSPRDAVEKLYGPTTPPPASELPPAADSAPDVSAPPAPTGRVAELEDAIATLREQRDQADDDFDKPEARRLTAEIEDTVGLLAQARIEAVSQYSDARTYQSLYVESVDAMEAKHEWATDETSLLYGLLEDKVTAAQARKDPALQEPDFIMKFADEIAEKFGKTPAFTPPPPPPPIQQRIVGGGVAPGHSEAHRYSAAEEKALIHNASKDELAAALFS